MISSCSALNCRVVRCIICDKQNMTPIYEETPDSDFKTCLSSGNRRGTGRSGRIQGGQNSFRVGQAGRMMDREEH